MSLPHYEGVRSNDIGVMREWRVSIFQKKTLRNTCTTPNGFTFNKQVDTKPVQEIQNKLSYH